VLPGAIGSEAFAVSADGSVVVGGSVWDSISQNGFLFRPQEAFRWTEEEGMVGLGQLVGAPSSRAHAVSADGSVIVGWINQFVRPGDVVFPYNEAFRWAPNEGMVLLDPHRTGNSSANFVSADGSLIFGVNPQGHYFVWDAAHGMRNLFQLLQDYGADLSGWPINEMLMTAVSPDGTIFVGVGTNPDGKREAWQAILDLPETPTLSGDYNNDATVDAADYVVCRKGLGTTYTQTDYDVWRTHFGQTAGNGAVDALSGWSASAGPLSGGVPEPAAWMLLLPATLATLLRRHAP
jgi:probable HAF family extracellular repeat protein